MATEVKHGRHPRFKVQLGKGQFAVTLVGHYTKKDGIGAGGATAWNFCSKRPSKRRAELLILRTSFVMWFLQEWARHGGAYTSASTAIKGYPVQRGWRSLKRRGPR